MQCGSNLDTWKFYGHGGVHCSKPHIQGFYSAQSGFPITNIQKLQFLDNSLGSPVRGSHFSSLTPLQELASSASFPDTKLCGHVRSPRQQPLTFTEVLKNDWQKWSGFLKLQQPDNQCTSRPLISSEIPDLSLILGWIYNRKNMFHRVLGLQGLGHSGMPPTAPRKSCTRILWATAQMELYVLYTYIYMP